MIANLQTVYPISPLLQQNIYCYYIIEGTGADFKNSHYSFPHTLNALSIYNNGIFYNEGYRIKTIGSADTYAPFCVLQGKCLRPLLVDMEGPLSRITILFKPLGLNNFIKPLLGEVMLTQPTLFTQWESKSFDDTLRYLFAATRDLKARTSSLEEFLLSIYKPVNIPILVNALDHLSDFDNEKSVETIAKLNDMPLRSFNRLFKAHLGVSPVVHRQIARFRHSLESKMFESQYKKLTDIGYNSNFYDQSYFTKLYKQLSGSSPKIFFKAIEQVGDSRLVFRYI
jgi:AraC-like DNA-binding protein